MSDLLRLFRNIGYVVSQLGKLDLIEWLIIIFLLSLVAFKYFVDLKEFIYSFGFFAAILLGAGFIVYKIVKVGINND